MVPYIKIKSQNIFLHRNKNIKLTVFEIQKSLCYMTCCGGTCQWAKARVWKKETGFGELLI